MYVCIYIYIYIYTYIHTYITVAAHVETSEPTQANPDSSIFPSLPRGRDRQALSPQGAVKAQNPKTVRLGDSMSYIGGLFGALKP